MNSSAAAEAKAPSKYVPPHLRRKVEEEASKPARSEAPSRSEGGGDWGSRGSSRRDDAPLPVNSRAEALAGFASSRGGSGGGGDGRGRDDRVNPPSDWGRSSSRDEGSSYSRGGPPPPEPGPNSRAERMMGAFGERSSEWGGSGGSGAVGGRSAFGGNTRIEEEIFGPQTAEQPSAGINFDKYDDIPISVTAASPDGVVPPPITTFAEAKMPQFLRDNIGKSPCQPPTPRWLSLFRLSLSLELLTWHY